MKIMTSSGKTYEADWILPTQSHHGAKLLAIQLPGTVDPVQAVADLTGAESIKSIVDDAVTTYAGYTMLQSLYFTHDRSAVRLTFEKGDAV